VHIRVPDRAEAARWYAEHLGFEPVGEFDFWASGFEGGPLQISADGGATTLALFEASEGRRGVVVTFLALLELAKEQLVEIVQEAALAPIYLKSLATQ
jgi:catechol 2,3-dioxygenase-like lactoylglutathione lyase family enzyme